MKSMRIKAYLVFWALVIGFACIVVRAVQFQMKPDNRLVRLSQSKNKLNQQVQAEELLTSRGAIVDRNGRDLALSVVVKSFFANPKVIKNPVATAQKLSPILGISTAKLTETLKQDRFFVWLKREVDDVSAKKIEALELEGVFARKESKRIYPQGDLARPVIGVSGLDGTGLEGIEKSYDAYLKSSDKGGAVSVRDALGRLLLFEDFEKEWFNSHHVISTLDIRLQKIVEEELRAVVDEKHPQSAQAIMMNPKTGEILAMASIEGKRPDPNTIRNRAVADVYEPGSTFKIILAAASLEHLGMTANSQIFAENGMLRVGSNVIKEYHNKKYQWISLQELLEVSSNVASAKLGLKMGASDLDSTLRHLGFGSTSGIDLPGEATGIIRNASSWKPIELANISFGQGLAVTPLQLVRAVSSVANGGYLVQPHIVSKVLGPQTPQGEAPLVWSADAQVKTKEVMPAERARALTDMLVHVTDKGSTGVEAAIEGFRIAGKTGTSQKLVEKITPRGRKIKTYVGDHSIVSFIGYVPAYDPAFLLLVLYDDPEGRVSGGMTAAPSFRKIASRALSILGISPSVTAVADASPRVEADVVPKKTNIDKDKIEKTDATQETGGETRYVGKSFQAVLKELKELSPEQRAKIDLIGYGIAIKEEIDSDQRMKVYFR